MAIDEIEGGGVVYVRGRVRSGGHSSVPSCVATPIKGVGLMCHPLGYMVPCYIEVGRAPTVAYMFVKITIIKSTNLGTNYGLHMCHTAYMKTSIF